MYEMMFYEQNTYFSLLSIYESNDFPAFFKFEGYTAYSNTFELVRKTVEHRHIESDMYMLVFRKNYSYAVPYIKDEFLRVIIETRN